MLENSRGLSDALQHQTVLGSYLLKCVWSLCLEFSNVDFQSRERMRKLEDCIARTKSLRMPRDQWGHTLSSYCDGCDWAEDIIVRKWKSGTKGAGIGIGTWLWTIEATSFRIANFLSRITNAEMDKVGLSFLSNLLTFGLFIPKEFLIYSTKLSRYENSLKGLVLYFFLTSFIAEALKHQRLPKIYIRRAGFKLLISDFWIAFFQSH